MANPNIWSDDAPETEDGAQEKVLLSQEEIGLGLKVLGLGSLVGVISYVVSWFIIGYITSLFLGNVWRNIIALSIALMILFAIDAAMGGKDTRMKAPVLVAVFITFLLFLFAGFGKENNSSDSNRPSQVYQKTSKDFIISGKEQIVSQSFSGGQEVRITIKGAPVDFDLVSGVKILNQEHGTYVFRFDSEGALKFVGRGLPSTIMVQW